MPDIKNSTTDSTQAIIGAFDYTDPKVLEEHKKYIQDLLYFDNLQGAYNLSKSLPQLLAKLPDYQKRYTDLHEEYQKIVNIAQFVALPLLRDNIVIELFEKHFLEMVKLPEINILDKIDAKLATMLHDERDEYKAKLRSAMERNVQWLTSKKLKIKGEDFIPTIGNWIKNYVGQVGLKPAEELHRAQYYINNPYFDSLSQEEKELVKKTLAVYERLKLSSLTMEGLEESFPVITDDGKHKIFVRGRLEEVRSDALFMAVAAVSSGKMTAQQAKEKYLKKKAQDTAPTKDELKLKDELLKAYHGDPKMQTEILEEQRSLHKYSGSNNKKLEEEFYKAVQNKDISKVIALFLLLAQRNHLDVFLSEDQKLRKYLLAAFPKVYGKTEANLFGLSPKSGHSIQLFIKYILQERLGLNEHDAARVGMQVSNIYKKLDRKDFDHFAYFDMSEKGFRWMK